ncbi:hypothetical protein ACEPAF_8551 [Sanghuangporus sanghuang]
MESESNLSDDPSGKDGKQRRKAQRKRKSRLEQGQAKDDHFLSKFEGSEKLLIITASGMLRLYMLAYQFFSDYYTQSSTQRSILSKARQQLDRNNQNEFSEEQIPTTNRMIDCLSREATTIKGAFIRTAREIVLEYYSITPGRDDKDVKDIYKGRIEQLSDKITEEVKETAMRKALKAAKKGRVAALIGDLLEEPSSNYMFATLDSDKGDPYSHKAIYELIARTVFTHTKDLVALSERQPGWVWPIPIHLIAVAMQAICCALEEHSSGNAQRASTSFSMPGTGSSLKENTLQLLKVRIDT